ncbi:MAG: arginine--tRNA ligase [Nitriliruptor sp.]|uniref:arginine--tRNA ligase n=1 Tax=Nitriliruptor sp. TaxID=2448056 RepID=UPI00349FF4B8
MARPELHDPVLADLAARIRAALVAAGLPDTDPALERPKQADHGDWATTVALRLAKPAKRPPREIAQVVLDHLELPDVVAEADIAGPGFVNFRFAHRYHQDLVRRILAEGLRYARTELADDQRETVNVEFVSANPTGPLHVGAGRWAATGDAIAELLEAAGHAVSREYYVNDAGEQIRRFGESVVLVAEGRELTEDHYRGSYVADIAADLRAEHGDALFTTTGVDAPTLAGGGAEHAAGPGSDLVEDAAAEPSGLVDPQVAARVGVLAVESMRQRIETQLHELGVDFDVWFSETSLHESGAIAATVAQLISDGQTYEHDGAVFLRTEAHGDDKDRVLIRSDGRPTYFAADCAYIRDKWARVSGGDGTGGGGRLIYLLGADHHGYVARLHAAAACLGIPVDRVEIRIGQLVNLLRGGQPVKMSKRAGETIDLDEVVEEVGVDVTRYAFLRQSLDSTVDFDLAVVTQQSMENPVYYVQYAHARISSILRAADERGFDPGPIADADLALLDHPAELELLTAMAQLPLVVAEAAELRATQRLARYAEELAGTFHRFYTECRILAPDVPDRTADETRRLEELGRARYHLALAAKQVLADALGLLRVAAPERL